MNGDTYFVIRVNANQFQLSGIPGGPALVLGQGALSGVQTLGAEGVALDGEGVTGFQSLVVDLTSAGSGLQKLVGAGGAAANLGQANQTYSASATGSSSAVFGATSNANAQVTINGTTVASVGSGAKINAAFDVSVAAMSNRTTAITASGGGGAVGASGDSIGVTFDVETTTAEIQSGATLTSGQDVLVSSMTRSSATANSTLVRWRRRVRQSGELDDQSDADHQHAD